MNKKIGTIRNSTGEILEYEFHQGSMVDRNLLIIGHGLGGSMNRMVVRTLALAASSEGLSVLRFSFSGNGGSEGSFEGCTLNKQVDDLKSVVSRMIELGWIPIYAGHGLGATVGSLYAASNSNLKMLVSIAGIVETDKFFEREFGKLSPGGSYMWDDLEYPLSRSFALSMKEVASIANCSSAIRIPWLLVHGTSDSLVPLKDSQIISNELPGTRKLIEINGADHVFSEESMGQLTEVVLDWIAHELSSLRNN